MTPLVGFAPDADPATPGVLLDCTNFIPAVNGMEAAPTLVTPTNVPALAAACQGAAVVSKLDDSRRIMAGTSSKIYESVFDSEEFRGKLVKLLWRRPERETPRRIRSLRTQQCAQCRCQQTWLVRSLLLAGQK